MEQAAERSDNNGSPEGEPFSRTAKKFEPIRLEWGAKLLPVRPEYLTMEICEQRSLLQMRLERYYHDTRVLAELWWEHVCTDPEIPTAKGKRKYHGPARIIT